MGYGSVKEEKFKDPNMPLTIAQLKSRKRKAAKLHAKLTRQVASLTKIHEDTNRLFRQSDYLKGEIRNLLDPHYQPPVKEEIHDPYR